MSAGGPPPGRASWRQAWRFAWLYATEGAPIGFLWWALPVHLARAGVPEAEVAALLALIVLPWGLKVLWAPAIDALRSERFATRHWIGAAQLMMAATLAPLLVLDPVSQRGAVTLSLVLHAVAAATQDGAIDGLAIRTIPSAARGRVNAAMQVGLLGSRALFGGGALLLADSVGLPALVGALMTLLVLSAAATLRLPPDGSGSGGGALAAVFVALRGSLTRRATWAGLSLALVAGAGFKALTALAGPLLVARGAEQTSLGLFFSFGAVGAMALGAVLGGLLADGSRRRLVVGLAEGAAALLVLAAGALLSSEGAHVVPGLLALLGLLYLAIGLATAPLYALLMDLTEPASAVTQFCLFMGAINLCESWSTAALGALITRWGEGPAVAALALPSLAVLVALRWIPARTAGPVQTPGAG